MKTLVLFFMSVTVALGRPNFPSQVEKDPVLGEKNQPPVAADWVPVQGHVVVEHPAPQVLPSPKEQKEEKAEPEAKETPDRVQELKPEQEVKVEEELKPEQEPAPEAPVAEEAAKLEPEAESELVEEPDYQVESEVKVKVEGQPLYELEDEEEEIDPRFRLQPEPKVVADVQMELEPEEAPVLKEAPEKFQAQGVEERHIDMEGKPQPVMELEPLDEEDTPAEEVSDTEMSEEEMAFREALQEQDTDAAAELLPEEEEELEDMADGEEDFGEKESNVSDEQELNEPEPEMTGEQNPEDAADPVLLDKELLDLQHTMPLSGNYFPEEEAGMEMYAREEGVPEESPEEQGMEDEGLPMMMRDDTYRQGERYCPGFVSSGKCFQFFREPKKYEDAEFFCQEQFSGGHLASITSLHVHQELIRLIQINGGYTRTWVGGRRLDSHRFVWLDGSRWSYDDWLPGEPNHTAGVENCLEILGNGKFNDFTCWEPQAFVCSYPSQ